jgi:hypothetical protein
MSRKYIAQVDSLDFVYPNNFTAEYDLEIVHDINNNCVSGVTTVFSATTINSTGITFNIQGSWSLNGAEPYVNINGGFLSLASIHMMGPTQSYYRPWRLVDNISSTGLTNTNVSFNENFTVLPSYLGLTGFTTGTYYFEVRMIGKKCVYPICVILPITVSPPSSPTPTPTNTPTPTVTPTSTPGLTSTPTPTPTPTATSGGVGDKSLEIYGRDIAGTRATLTLFYSINGGLNINVPGYTGDQLPSSCSLLYTITGLTVTDNVTIGTSTNCVMTGNGSSSSCPSSSGSFVDYTYAMDAPSIQQVAITINSDIIP